MGKGSALGHDPLNWMKAVNENKKIPSEGVNAVTQNAKKSVLPTNSQITVKQQPLGITHEETSDILKVSPSPDKVDGILNTATPPKGKVVIGRLYEKLSPEKVKSTQLNEGTFQETRHRTESTLPESMTMQMTKRTVPETNRRPAAIFTSQFSNYLIVAYTALILILGYVVYHDLSKRMSKIEAKILAIEKTLNR